MDDTIEQEMIDVRRNLEIEIEQGMFPNIDLDEVIDTLRQGIIDIREGRGIPFDEFWEELENEYVYNRINRSDTNE